MAGLSDVFKKAGATGAKAFKGIFVPIEFATSASTTYDPDSGTIAKVSSYENTKMMFDKYKQYEVDGKKILTTDLKGVIPQNDLIITPKVGDAIFKIDDSVIIDGGLSASTSWDAGSGWDVGGGIGTCDGTQGSRLAQGSATLDQVSFIMGYDASLVSGILNTRLQDTLVQQHTASAISYKAKVKAGAGLTGNNISFDSQNSPNQFNGFIDNVVLYPILDEYYLVDINQDPAGAMWEFQLRKR